MAELEVSGITKRFGDLTANDNISFAVRAGQVLAILGENGAGKSTLMKVVSGFLRPDAGRVLVDGHPLPAGDPEAAIRAGIGMIHQHFMLIPRMTVLENLILGQEPRTRFGGIDRRRGEQLVRELADRFGMEIDPRRTVESLTVGEQQRIEIIKAFYRGAKILILDEPTALLTPQETDR
nr:ATP-binding cassette domain-containing protein [Thermaerobacter sp.]